jgi:hypothetical protein
VTARLRRSALRTAWGAFIASVLILGLGTSSAAASATIGADVANTSNTSNAGCVPACTFEDTADVPAQPMQAPCAGTVTTWRVNATTSATFSLRVIRNNGDGTYTSTASSGAQTTTGAGIAVFPTSLAIAEGEYIGVDISAASVLLGRTSVGATGNVFRPPMVDGTPQSVDTPAPDTVLVNADVACASAPAGPTGLRAGALKKCKKRAHKHHWSHKRLKKCKKKANLLPV